MNPYPPSLVSTEHLTDSGVPVFSVSPYSEVNGTQLGSCGLSGSPGKKRSQSVASVHSDPDPLDVSCSRVNDYQFPTRATPPTGVVDVGTDAFVRVSVGTRVHLRRVFVCVWSV